jgi:hypothetical protein
MIKLLKFTNGLNFTHFLTPVNQRHGFFMFGTNLNKPHPLPLSYEERGVIISVGGKFIKFMV